MGICLKRKFQFVGGSVLCIGYGSSSVLFLERGFIKLDVW